MLIQNSALLLAKYVNDFIKEHILYASFVVFCATFPSDAVVWVQKNEIRAAHRNCSRQKPILSETLLSLAPTSGVTGTGW